MSYGRRCLYFSLNSFFDLGDQLFLSMLLSGLVSVFLVGLLPIMVGYKGWCNGSLAMLAAANLEYSYGCKVCFTEGSGTLEIKKSLKKLIDY